MNVWCQRQAKKRHSEIKPKLKKALPALTVCNFGSMTATGWIFLPKCS